MILAYNWRSFFLAAAVALLVTASLFLSGCSWLKGYTVPDQVIQDGRGGYYIQKGAR